jgi:hypothetical protein
VRASAIPAIARINTLTDMAARYISRRRRASSLWAENRDLRLLTGAMNAAFDAATLDMKQMRWKRSEMT